MKTLFAFFAILMCLNISAQKDKGFASKWRENSNGQSVPASSDWLTTKKGIFFYCLSNDDKNIYVDAKITESIEQNKILQMGITVWVNTDGKARKITGIRFPVGAQFSRGQSRRGDMNIPLNQATPLSQANTVELVGFKGVEPNRFPSNNTDNIRGSVKYDNDGNLLYSLTIPLSKLPEGVNGSATPMAFAIEYGAPPAMGGQGGRPGGYTPPAGGSRSGGSRSGGGSRGGSGGGGAPGGGAPAPVVIWMKDIKLAEKK
jgi:uncharacterized membrane protein YgcG